MELYQHPQTGEWTAVPKPIPLRLVIRNAMLNALAYTAGDQKAAAGWLEITPRVFAWQMDSYAIPHATAGDVRASRSPNGTQRPHRRPPSLVGAIPSRKSRGRHVAKARES